MKQTLLRLSIVCCISAATEAQAQGSASISHIMTAGYPVPGNGSFPSGFAVFNGKLYFSAQDSAHGFELWSYDEKSPAKLVYDLNPDTIDGTAKNTYTTVYKNKLYLGAADTPGASRMSLFAYDGTNPPALVTNTGTGFYYGSNPRQFRQLGNRLFFVASRWLSMNNNSRQDEIYSYDGVNPPIRHTFPAGGGIGGPGPYQLTLFNGKLYFAAWGISYQVLHVFDTLANTASEIVPNAGANGANQPDNLVVAGNVLYFTAYNATYGRELWSYDGTTVKRLTDLAAGNKNGVRNTYYSNSTEETSDLVYYKGAIYFGGSTDGSNYQLYKLDTATGTATLASVVNPAGSGEVHNLFVYKSSLYFLGTTAAAGEELWRYDGSTCAMVADLNSGTGPVQSNFYGLLHAEYNKHLYFNGWSREHKDELFRLNDATGIQNVRWDGELSLYPNPATTDISISLSLGKLQALQISLTDISGREVYSSGLKTYTPGKHKLEIPIASFVPGQYFYRISGTDGQLLSSGSLIKR
jgi:ELWxxDGT repeat protein